MLDMTPPSLYVELYMPMYYGPLLVAVKQEARNGSENITEHALNE